MTGTCTPEAERFASTEGTEEATSTPQWGEVGCCPGRWFVLAVVTGARRANMRDNGEIHFAGATGEGSYTLASHTPSAVRKVAPNIPGLDAVADEYLAIDSGAPGRKG